MERFIKMAIMRETEDEQFNVSINIIEAESPEPTVRKARRPIHSRSNSDVTPRCVCPPPPVPPAPPPPASRPHPRSRSLGARPSHKQTVKQHQTLSVSVQKSSMSHLAVDFSPHLEISTLSSILAKCETVTTPICSPRKIRSEQPSPSVSVISIPDTNPSHIRVAPLGTDKSGSQLVYIPSDPWTKQSDNAKNVKKLTRTNHLSLECSPADNGPWILNPSRGYSQSQRQLYRKAKSFSKPKSTVDSRKIESLSTIQVSNNLATRRNSKLERLSPVSCNTCWSTDTCKCSKVEDNPTFNIPLSPASLDKSPEFPLPSRSSPIRSPVDKQVKKSPVIIKKHTRSLPVSSLKCLHDFDGKARTNGKAEMVCTCAALKQGWISPRPSPRKSLPRSDYFSLSKDNEVDSSEALSRKCSFSKVVSTNNSHPNVSDIVESPHKSVKGDATELKPPRAELMDPGTPKPIDACDPLLETTC